MSKFSPEEVEAFEKDALLQKLQHELDEANEYIEFLVKTINKLTGFLEEFKEKEKK